jgi:hypothetical protein
MTEPRLLTRLRRMDGLSNETGLREGKRVNLPVCFLFPPWRWTRRRKGQTVVGRVAANLDDFLPFLALALAVGWSGRHALKGDERETTWREEAKRGGLIRR